MGREESRRSWLVQLDERARRIRDAGAEVEAVEGGVSRMAEAISRLYAENARCDACYFGI